MKIKFSLLALSILISLLLLFTCINSSNKHKVTSKDIKGRWTQIVNDDLFKGYEVIAFEDESFVVTDSLLFSGVDSNFKFTLPLTTSISGNWSLKEDSLFLSYNGQTVMIVTDTDQCQIINQKQVGSNSKLQTIKEEMINDLDQFVRSYFSNSYEKLTGKKYFLGCVSYAASDTIIIEKDNSHIILTRTP